MTTLTGTLKLICPLGQPVLFFGCPFSKDLLHIKTQRRPVKMSILCKMCVKWVWQTNTTPAVCPWCSSSLHSLTLTIIIIFISDKRSRDIAYSLNISMRLGWFCIKCHLSRLVRFYAFQSWLKIIALQKVEFSCALVGYQSIEAYLAMQKLALIVTNILFAQKKMAATNMFLLPICFEVVPLYFSQKNKWQQRDVTELIFLSCLQWLRHITSHFLCCKSNCSTKY